MFFYLFLEIIGTTGDFKSPQVISHTQHNSNGSDPSRGKKKKKKKRHSKQKREMKLQYRGYWFAGCQREQFFSCCISVYLLIGTQQRLATNCNSNSLHIPEPRIWLFAKRHLCRCSRRPCKHSPAVWVLASRQAVRCTQLAAGFARLRIIHLFT